MTNREQTNRETDTKLLEIISAQPIALVDEAGITGEKELASATGLHIRTVRASLRRLQADMLIVAQYPYVGARTAYWTAISS